MYFAFLVVAVTCSLCHLVYAASGNVLVVYRVQYGRPMGGVFNAVWKWSKWPAFANLFVSPMWDASYGNWHWWNPILYALNLWVWWSLKDAGDDDWSKKLKARLDAKIEQIRGKLVVVPVVAR